MRMEERQTMTTILKWTTESEKERDKNSFTIYSLWFSQFTVFTIKQNRFVTKDTALEAESFLWP